MTKKRTVKDSLIGIKVLGVGGSGCNVVNRMYKSRLSGIEFFAVNSDLQALKKVNGPKKIQIGKKTTQGLGTGMNPELGRMAAEESKNEIEAAVKGCQMVFITCGFGGGTGSGAAPAIAEISKKLGLLTVVVSTAPFSFEGKIRKEIADQAIEQMKNRADALIIVSNDRLLEVSGDKKTLLESFSLVDEILRKAIIGISGIILLPGLINIDFADIKTIIENSGQALLGIGSGSGEERAKKAAQQAMENPLLDLTLSGAKGILFSIRGDKNLTLYEVDEAAKTITQNAGDQAKIIFGAVIDETLKDEIEITIIASRFSDFIKEKEEEKEFVPFTTQARNLVENLRKTPRETEKKTKEEEELEIPAFLRKKIK